MMQDEDMALTSAGSGSSDCTHTVFRSDTSGSFFPWMTSGSPVAAEGRFGEMV